jgi:hypothetical protein
MKRRTKTPKTPTTLSRRAFNWVNNLRNVLSVFAVHPSAERGAPAWVGSVETPQRFRDSKFIHMNVAANASNTYPKPNRLLYIVFMYQYVQYTAIHPSNSRTSLPLRDKPIYFNAPLSGVRLTTFHIPLFRKKYKGIASSRKTTPSAVSEFTTQFSGVLCYLNRYFKRLLPTTIFSFVTGSVKLNVRKPNPCYEPRLFLYRREMVVLGGEIIHIPSP